MNAPSAEQKEPRNPTERLQNLPRKTAKRDARVSRQSVSSDLGSIATARVDGQRSGGLQEFWECIETINSERRRARRSVGSLSAFVARLARLLASIQQRIDWRSCLSDRRGAIWQRCQLRRCNYRLTPRKLRKGMIGRRYIDEQKQAMVRRSEKAVRCRVVAWHRYQPALRLACPVQSDHSQDTSIRGGDTRRRGREPEAALRTWRSGASARRDDGYQDRDRAQWGRVITMRRALHQKAAACDGAQFGHSAVASHVAPILDVGTTPES